MPYPVVAKAFSAVLVLLLLCCAAALSPKEVVRFLPRPLVACLMLHTSLDILHEAVVETRHRLSRFEYATVLIMGLLCEFWGLPVRPYTVALRELNAQKPWWIFFGKMCEK